MKTAVNLMVDIETVATSPKSLVRCISLLPFTLEKEEEVDALQSRALTVWLSIDDQINAGREVDDDTVAFWRKQDPAMSKLILEGNPADMPVDEALAIISSFTQDVAPTGLIYSRGSNFDFPILESLFKDAEMAFPWSTWKLACSKSILRFVCENDKETEAALVGGLKSSHESSYDCAVEAKKLQAVYAVLQADS